MIWETMEKEDRRAIEDSLACRVFLDPQVQQVSRERRESSDPVAKGDPLGQSGPKGKKGTSASRALWDHQELVESVVTLDQRDLPERMAPQVHLDLPDPPLLPWRTCLAALKITTPALLPLLSSARTRLCQTATPQMPFRPIRESRPP